ncbi:hypothetical protein DSM112329_00253 [Paraconexibacter sp. AEG42_29]|uniref:N-acetyltransferase domain-containing protein n=1 Tax=Paraconexibacter sp. AEG42_29 TaxID=2997339 RepID=A0AAU7APC0_9ACTN
MGEVVIITSLELTDAALIVAPSRPAPDGLRVDRSPDVALSRELYRTIGADYRWTDRLPWDEDAWVAHHARVETYVARLGDAVAGYYELDVAAGSAEVSIFGLLAHARGTGLGGHLLADALRRGLTLAPRVWLHTCTDDDPRALPNYRARGLRVFDVRPA